jgi:hypothetical protein
MIIAVMGALAGCKAGRWRKDDNQNTGGTVVLPRQVAAATAAQPVTPEFVDGAAFDIDEKTGRPKATLVLRLDYFPEVRPGAANLPSCYRPFPVEFELGKTVCATKPGLEQPLMVGNVDQDCYTDPDVPRTRAATPVALLGCKRASIKLHKFDPQLRVDAELKEL